ncbi:cytochrome p450 monooxygenase [Trichoderma arundinaceum]|uniref:Cytochrome p450 monooxygenase n=1 Tax=Trichoderma arundinaceum TaxID=490622 RepID=A0A395NWX8_TRIAR|nr:cytochrome p450 monooxygenase [Trichoderma arundinaceum]
MESFFMRFIENYDVSTTTGMLLASGTFFIIVLSYYLGKIIHQVYFHPLSRIPGPKLAAATRLVYARNHLKGDLVRWLFTLHEKYGDVVRIAPDEVSFICDVWQDIYGFHTGEKAAKGKYLKDRRWFAEPYNETWSILQADADAHSRMRRVIAPAFSDKALREQDSLIQGYVGLFIQRLHEQGETEAKGKVDIVRWYNYFTFDIIADMTFGEPFYCLRDSDYHPWVEMVFTSVRAITLNSVIRRYPLLQSIAKRFAPKNLLEMRRNFNMFVFDRVTKRLAMETAKPDLMTQIVNHPKEQLTKDEIDSNANITLVAGSETTASLLSGCTYLLLKNPDKLRKLTDEIRGTFNNSSEVTVAAVNELPYLNAVLTEALRIYPPNASGFMRIVPGSGDFLAGYWIPGGTAVSISQWPANHSSRNFLEPETFAPERFLGDARFDNDNKNILNPFSFGPRNCLGKALLLDFDLELVDPTQNWFDQKIFTLWEKLPLMVKLNPVRSFDG